MAHKTPFYRTQISRRTMLAATAAMAATPALAQECRLGPSPHDKGPLIFMDYDQVELDASYDQRSYEPLLMQVTQRLASSSEAARTGPPPLRPTALWPRSMPKAGCACRSASWPSPGSRSPQAR